MEGLFKLEETGSRRTGWIRWIVAAIIIAVIVAVVSGIALPYAISTDLVKDRLEREISEWTGHQVELIDRPEIGFWPVPHIDLNRVSITSQLTNDAEPILYADEIKADFSILSALTGDPSFSNFIMVRPIMRVERLPDGRTPWYSSSGRISEAVAATIAKSEAANGEDAAKAMPVPDYRLGDVTIQDGTLSWTNSPAGVEERVTAINGTISWPRLNSQVRGSVKGIIRGEAIALTVVSDKPLALLARQTAPINLQMVSTPLTFSFDGSANLSDKPFFGGKLNMQSTSMRLLLEWAGTKIKPGEALGAVSLDAEVQIQRGRSILDKLILELEGNRGIGVLDIEYSDEQKPGVSGTLAFSTLDIMSFLRAFTPLPQSGDDISSTIDTSFLHQLSLDLRLSAQSATLGPLNLTNVAAAGRIADGRATFDVGDATAYGGRLLGRIMLAEKGIEGGGGIKFSGRDINLEQALNALNYGGPILQGQASFDINLASRYPAWATAATDLDGKFKLSIVNGAIPAFNLAEFKKRATSEQFFDISTVADGSLAFQTAEIDVDLSNGQALVKTGEIVSANATLELTGVIPYARGGLALVGTLTEGPPASETTEAGDPTPETRFFVGGSWPRPVISPIFLP